MALSVAELIRLWEKEKDSYKKQEIGSGVQKFVKEVLKCETLFNLKEGKLASKDEKRKNEFLQEKSKKSRRADIIIFVDAERIIPVEVERYGNIKAGRQQILDYQRIWDKKYGLLTDGYQWVFYNNTVPVQTFRIDDILRAPSELVAYWTEYTQLENYYLRFFEKAGQLELYEQDLTIERRRQNFFQDATTLIRSFQNKLNIKGYFNKVGERESEKKAVEITYAYLIQFILYKTLVDNEFENFKDDFAKRLQRIHDDLKNGNYSDILTAIKYISDLISKNIYRPFLQEQELINNKLDEVLSKAQNELTDVTPWLDIFVFIKRYNFGNVRDEIFGYIYENYLKDLYSEEKKGQYFTDPAVVNFMLDQVGYTPRNIKSRLEKDKDSISLIDPSCGSGTFLYSGVRNITEAVPNGSLESSKTIEELVNNNIYGLDIEEFPLYLAEMSIIMRMLPFIINEKYNNPIDKKIKVFKTKDSVAEFLDTAIRNTLSDINVEYQKNKRGQLALFTKELNLGYSSYVRDEDDLKDMKMSLENYPKIARFRFDFVVGNPPYVGYNECSKQGLLFFELLKESEVKLNNVYGVNLHSIPDKPKRYRPNPNLYAFFIAVGIALLKDHGRLCYIVPQTLLMAGDLDVIRYHLSKFVTIEKIFTFSGKMFIGRGIRQNRPIPTSSLIFVLNRRPPTQLSKVEIIHYKDPNDAIEKCLGNILRGVKTSKKTILQNQLLQNVANWNFITKEKDFIDFYTAYKNKAEDIALYYEHPLAELHFKSKFYFDSGYDIDERKFLESPPKQDWYQYPRLNNEYWTIKESRGYWPNNRDAGARHFIKLRQANQGYFLLDSSFKILWSYANPQKFFFTEKSVIWPRNQICAIGSENKRELFYLFALLNSPVNMAILTNLLKSENEKNLQISTSSVKEFVRIPRISDRNINIKKEIIKQTQKMLNFDERTLADLVDFANLIMQKFDDYSVGDSYLILRKKSTQVKCKISRDQSLVESAISSAKGHLLFAEETLSLSELKSLPAIDFAKQQSLKSYIDDLVFALYFDVYLPDIGIDNADQVRKKCHKNRFYRLFGS
jgi:hypothetical protein